MRRASGRPIILTFYGQYFGLSYSGQASGTLEAGMRADVMPLVGGYVYAPYPNPYRSPLVSRTGGRSEPRRPSSTSRTCCSPTRSRRSWWRG